jgi:uncharacterized protein
MKLRIITTLSCSLLLLSCSNMHNVSNNAASEFSASHYLQLAATAPAQQKQVYQIKALTLELNNHQTMAAQNTLRQVDPQQLPTNMLAQYRLNKATLDTLNRKYTRSQKTLNAILNKKMAISNEQKIELYTLSIRNNSGAGNIAAALKHYQSLANIVKNNPTQYLDAAKNCWNFIQNISTNELNQTFTKTNDQFTKGWLALQNIIHDPLINQSARYQQLQQWQLQYPSHIANLLLPKHIPAASTPTDHIALLLPDSGVYKDSAQAIQRGFLSAYFTHQLLSSDPTTVTFINTASQPIDQAYQQALNSGANIIVGPLTKSAVKQLNNSKTIPIPTLTLNTLPANTTSQPLLYQISLSPADEIAQIITKAKHDRHQRAIIIAPQSDWGQQLAHDLSQAWQTDGGAIATQMNYPLKKDLTEQIKDTLNVNNSINNKLKIESIIQKKVRMSPRIRQDFDVIFLIADTQHAKQIRPLLKFYYAGDIPIYAISNINQGNTNTQRDRDLDGILFSDAPWVLNKTLSNPELNSTREQARDTWPATFEKQPKLLALGADSFNAAIHLHQIIDLPKLGFPGATGILYLNSQRKLIPTREWAEFIHGKVVTHGIA